MQPATKGGLSCQFSKFSFGSVVKLVQLISTPKKDYQDIKLLINF
jgi:hypothetical protein